jgi:CubicO group peptidase (beta-lactamase class C family)
VAGDGRSIDSADATVPRRVLVGVVALAVVLGGVYAWALASLDTSTVARTLVWMQSDTGDKDRFPVRAIAGSAGPVAIQPGPAPEALTTATVDGRPLEDFLAETDTIAFLVVHGDRLVGERYYDGAGRDTIVTSFSSAKSFVSTLVGLAIEDGHLDAVDDPITSYLPELGERDGRFADITIRHLLTMSSGIRYIERSLPWSDDAITYYAPDLRAAALDVVIERAPGEEFLYNNYNLLLEGLILERATGRSVASYLESRLWQPLGAGAAASWSLDSDWSGFEKMESGLNARPIDFCLLGIAFRDGGRIGGRQVVPEAWVTEATRVDTVGDPVDFYQYHWWIDPERGAFAAAGRYGQFVYVHPESDAVICRFGHSDGGAPWFDILGELAEALGPPADG